MATGSRRRGREAAVQILFQMDLSEVSPVEAGELFWQHLAAGRPGDAAARRFATRLVEAFLRRRDLIDESIREVSDNWRLERMPVIDRNILRLAIYEMLFEAGVPKVVIVDEAIELAKKFGSENSGRFVNGLLDAVLKSETGERSGSNTSSPSKRPRRSGAGSGSSA